MERPVEVDVYYPLPEEWGFCPACETLLAQAGLDDPTHSQELERYPGEYRAELLRLNTLVNRLAERYPDQVTIRVLDPRTPQGLRSSLLHNLHRYPAFLIHGQGKVSGWQEEALQAQIEQALRGDPPPVNLFTRGWAALRGLVTILGQMVYGMTVYEMVRDLRKERSYLERMFVLITFGDLLGIPILPPYYTLRLLPYVVPNLNAWRHSLLRERDLTDLCDQEIT